ncbi:uncharacterized protein LOC124545677 [Schistocerca americana]|uniref:uncharacterized protein LOC124545677 n=1 Tax=Schistocerca americana TaxID=7009 RepID=UPI001F4FE486|nr:uncharacterized protein LOC124545677 [Schistocerca americana]
MYDNISLDVGAPLSFRASWEKLLRQLQQQASRDICFSLPLRRARSRRQRIVYIRDEETPEQHQSSWQPPPSLSCSSVWRSWSWPRWRRNLQTYQLSLSEMPPATRSRYSRWWATELLETRRCKTAGGRPFPSTAAERTAGTFQK